MIVIITSYLESSPAQEVPTSNKDDKITDTNPYQPEIISPFSVTILMIVSYLLVD